MVSTVVRDVWKSNTRARRAAIRSLAATTTFPVVCSSGISQDCVGVLQAWDPWVAGHKLPRLTHPQLAFELSNLQVECRACSDSQGGHLANAVRRGEVTRSGFLRTGDGRGAQWQVVLDAVRLQRPPHLYP